MIAVLWRRRASDGRRVATAGLGLLLAYVGARAVLHERALEAAAAQLPARSVVRAAALPSPLDPFRWRVIADTGDAYWSGDVDLRGRSAPLARRAKLSEDATVAKVREVSRIASIFLDFSQFPYLEVEKTPQGTALVWRDLRFEGRGRDGFVTRVVVGPDGRIRSQSFRF